jgi:hypothetical protein
VKRTIPFRPSLLWGSRHWRKARSDAVNSQYKPKFEFSGGTVIKVIFDVADDVYADVEQHFAAAMARD